jgi:hypothetical protein
MGAGCNRCSLHCRGDNNDRAMKPSINRLLLVAILISCGGSDSTTEPPPPATPVPTSVQLAAATISLRMGETSQLTATVVDQHGTPMAGQSIAWTSSDTTRITVSATGLARGVRPGTASITASSGTLTKSAAGTVLAPQLVVESSASVTRSITATGGTISAQASNGTQFTLTIPPTAVLGSVDITLTPITSIQNLPAGTTVVAAVRMRPDGLTFLAPASLAMAMPNAPSSANLVGLRFNDDGSGLQLTPVTRTGSTVTIPISHFSGAGAANTTSPPLIPLDGSGTVESDALNQLVLLDLAAQSSGSYDVGAITTILHSWYTSLVKPRLQAAATDESALQRAISVWARWRDAITGFQPSIAGALDAATAAQQSEAKSLAATALQAAIQRNNATCIAQSDLVAARKVLQWHGVAEYHALATPENALDRSTVLNGLCVKVGYGQVSLPDPLVPMQPATLRVQAGLRFGPGPLQFTANPSVDVAVSATGSTDATTRHHQTDATGIAQTTLTPTGGTLQVALHSCINDAVGGLVSIVGLTLFDVCRDTTVSRNAGDAVFYENTFSTSVGSEWSSTSITTSPSGERYLGDFKAPTNFRDTAEVQLTLAGLPSTHNEVTIEFDLYVIDHWDGSAPTPGGPDIFTFSAAGTLLKKTTFANDQDDPQAYPGDWPGGSNPAGTGALATNTLGYTDPLMDNYADAIYRLKFTVPHNGSTVTFKWTGSVQSMERFGIDNVRVTVR